MVPEGTNMFELLILYVENTCEALDLDCPSMSRVGKRHASSCTVVDWSSVNCTVEVVFSSGGCSLEVPFQCARLTLGLYEAASFWLDVPTVGLYLVCKAGLSRLLPIYSR